MEVKGVIKEMFGVKQITQTFSKSEIVVTTSEQYPQEIIIQFTNDRIQLLNGYRPGEFVDVKINLKGRGYPDKNTGQMRYFNTVEGWAISRPQQQQYQNQQSNYQQPQQSYQQPQQGYQQQQQNYQAPQQNNFNNQNQQPPQDKDDLPF